MDQTEMTKGIFITGTDTGVGKTIVAGAIARYLVEKGIDCGVMKPIESGCRNEAGRLIPADGTYLKAAARSSDPIDLITSYRFETPLAPYALTIQENAEEVELEKVVNDYQELSAQHRFMIVEGMGGLMVPLTGKHDLIDLIRLLNLPVLLVARSGLGTLNHTLLSLGYGQAQGITFSAVVLNQPSAKPEISEESNRIILTERCKIPVIGPLPHFKTCGDSEIQIQACSRIIRQNTSVQHVIESLALRS